MVATDVRLAVPVSISAACVSAGGGGGGLPRLQLASVDQLPVPVQKLVVVGILNPPCNLMGCPPRLRPCLAEVSWNYSKESRTETVKNPGPQRDLAPTAVSISIRSEMVTEDWDGWLKRDQPLA